MKKNILLLLAVVMLAMTSCEDPKYVAPTADRQGLTSLTAIFTSGPFVDQTMAKLDITDPIPDRLVIPVPYYYPETSDDETAQYMNKVRVQAALAANCYISPALTVLDLTKENEFTFTDAQGNSKKIIITGERVKSSACDLLSFATIDPAIAGIIDKTKKTVSLVVSDPSIDLSAVTAKADISAHATISPDPATPQDYSKPVKFTVTAHNGTTSQEYTVVVEQPEKIDQGFNKETVELLFNMDPVANLGMPAFDAPVGPTIAAIDGKVILCPGNGSTPIYVNGQTGAKQGEINLGSAVADAITNDEAEHLLICNHVAGYEVMNIYVTSSVTEAPKLLHSFTNDCSFPMGSKIKCIGDVTKDALITITNEGVDGVSACSNFTTVEIKDGAVVKTTVNDLAPSGYLWGSAPVNFTTVVPRTKNISDGVFLSYYEPSQFSHVASDWTTVTGRFPSDTSGWGLNPNCLDSKAFNNQNYVALFVVSHFPAWGMGPQLYLYNVSNMDKFTGNDITDVACLEIANSNVDWFQVGSFSVASGDVVIAPSADGYKLYLYYYDHNSQAFGGYTADCIKR